MDIPTEGSGVESSSFGHQGPLALDRFYGRDELIADLAARVSQRRVTALFGPEGFGKTSALNRLAAGTLRADLNGRVVVTDPLLADWVPQHPPLWPSRALTGCVRHRPAPPPHGTLHTWFL